MQKIIATIVLIGLGFSNIRAQDTSQVYYTNTKFLTKIYSTDKINYSYKVYKLPNSTYAYVIFANGEKYLHQQNMPGKPLTEGFETEAAAMHVAELVVKKLEYPTVPPKVSTLEMQYIEAYYSDTTLNK